MTENIPLISHMIIIDQTNYTEAKKLVDNSYYNSALDSENEYCLNTTAWD